MDNKSFLGQGMKFPPQINPATGRFETSSGAQSVKESIYLILMTQKTERVARPHFGASLMNYTFMDSSNTELAMMARSLQSDITEMEPRVDNVNVDIEPSGNGGYLIVNIRYTLRDSNVRDNLVFPFYLDNNWDNEGEDEDESAFEEL